MEIEFIKGIKLTGLGVKVIGDTITMDEKSGAETLINLGFAKEVEKKLTADEVANLIEACETIEDLKAYESDTRQVVKKAYDKKLKTFK